MHNFIGARFVYEIFKASCEVTTTSFCVTSFTSLTQLRFSCGISVIMASLTFKSKHCLFVIIWPVRRQWAQFQQRANENTRVINCQHQLKCKQLSAIRTYTTHIPHLDLNTSWRRECFDSDACTYPLLSVFAFVLCVVALRQTEAMNHVCITLNVRQYIHQS